MTRLAPIARAVFHEHDDALLAYLREEGQSIEPTWCAALLQKPPDPYLRKERPVLRLHMVCAPGCRPPCDALTPPREQAGLQPTDVSAGASPPSWVHAAGCSFQQTPGVPLVAACPS